MSGGTRPMPTKLAKDRMRIPQGSAKETILSLPVVATLKLATICDLVLCLFKMVIVFRLFKVSPPVPSPLEKFTNHGVIYGERAVVSRTINGSGGCDQSGGINHGIL